MYEDSDYIISSIFGKSFRTKTDLELDVINKVNPIFLDCDVITKEDYISDNRTKVIKYERPDLVIIDQEYAIIIEHFEVSTSKLTSKGYEHSKYYTDEYNKVISDKLLDEISEGAEFAKHTETTKVAHSFENLINNIFAISDKHYNKIDDYKERLMNDFKLNEKKIYTVFFVECNQLLPTFIVDKNEDVSVITPADDIRLIDYLRNRHQIDGMIIHFDETSNSNYYNGFILNMKHNLDEVVADGINYYDVNSIELHDMSHIIQTTFMGKVKDSK